MAVTKVLLAALAASASAATVRPEYGPNDYAKLAGKLYFGTAADIPGTGEIDDTYYMKHFNNSHLFGQATPANIMKWLYEEPEQGVFDFSGGDYFVNLAHNINGYKVRCHNLVWYNELPDWINEGTWTKEELLDIVRARVSNTVAHFGDSCYCWDVVNEALNDDGTYREDLFYNVTGTDYLTVAYQTAQQVIEEQKLSVKLYYNDYNIEYPGVKATAAQKMIVSFLKDQGIQIDGVGLESHFIVGETPSAEAQMQNMADFVALGVEVAVTELDIRTTLPVDHATKLQQVDDFNSTVAACALTDKCVGVTLWDFDDNYSWIPSTFAGQGWGTPWYQPAGVDTPLKRKIAYNGIISGFEAKIGPVGY